MYQINDYISKSKIILKSLYLDIKDDNDLLKTENRIIISNVRPKTFRNIHIPEINQG